MGLFGPDVEKMERQRDVEGLIKALKHKDTDVQNKAQTALVRIGEPAVEPLTQTLKDEDCSIRWRAAEALDELSWKPGDDVEKAYYLIAKMAWGELVMLGEPSIEPLIQALKDDDELVREAAEEALEKIKASTLAKTLMTKKFVHVIIYTEEPFEENEANIAGCVAAAFPEQIKDVDPIRGTFTLQEGKFECSLVRLAFTFDDPKIQDHFMSWIKSVKKGVHDLPRKCEIFRLLGTPSWGAIFFSGWLNDINPEFANSMAFIRKWSIIAGKLLVIGVWSLGMS